MTREELEQRNHDQWRQALKDANRDLADLITRIDVAIALMRPMHDALKAEDTHYSRFVARHLADVMSRLDWRKEADNDN